MNVPVSANHPQSYAIIQGNQPSILTSAASSTAPLQQSQPTGSGGGDVHICGTCGAHFTEIKEFVTHKQQGCQGSSIVGTQGTIAQPQLSSSTTIHQPQPPPGSVQMGVPVGMPHVILQTASGPPQMYRIVLEPSVPTSSPGVSMQGSTPILAQALSGAPVTQLSHSPGQHTAHSHQSPHQQQDVAVSQLVSANTSATCVSAGTLLQLAHVGDNWHSNSGTPIASGGTVENEGNSSIEGAATGRELVEGSSRGGSVENSASGVVTGSSSVTDGTPVIEGESEVTNATNSMHTEEEDVATFLATQLASQAAPPQTTAVATEHLISSVVNGVPSDAQLHYTSAPTQSHQHQPQMQLGLHQHQLMDTYNSGMRAGSNRRQPKTATLDEATQSAGVESKVEGHGSTQKEVVVQDGIRKEKICPAKDCFFSTSSNKDLNRHIRKHTGEKPYRCDDCGTCFSRGDKLKVHRRIHTNSRPYLCDEPGCQYRAIDSGSLRKHKRTHTNERPYRCQLCSYSARDGSQLTVHLRTHTGDTPFQCMVENCSAAFKTSSDLRRHERLHTGVKPYKCTACDYACAIKSNLTVHMRLNHFQGAKFSCTKCDFLGNSRKQLKEHEKTHANVLIQCELCDHVSTSSTGLRQHMLIHSQEKPFQCRYCSFTCKTTGNLRYHVRNKHGCDVSGRKKGSATSGMAGGRGRTAAGSAGGAAGRRTGRPSCYRSFKCSDCGSGFVREDSYRSHMRQHQKHKVAQAITGKMEPDVFSVVVQDENLLGVEQSTSTRDGDTLQPGTITQNSVPGGASAQANDAAVNGYSSYVITIDGISTVFSNPVRIAGSTVNTETGEQIPGTVEVITGDLITSSGHKGTTGPPSYDMEAENRVSTSHHGYNLSQENKADKNQAIYSIAPEDKGPQTHSTFGHSGVQSHSASNAEYITHTSSQQELQQVVLVQHHHQGGMEGNLEHSIQVHNLSGKAPKSEEV